MRSRPPPFRGGVGGGAVGGGAVGALLPLSHHLPPPLLPLCTKGFSGVGGRVAAKTEKKIVTKFKVLLYLKKGSTDKRGKAPIVRRITLNNSMAQFSRKLSCTPNLWNPRSGRLDGKSREAVEVNTKIDKMLLNINSACDNLLKRNANFTVQSIQKNGDNNIKM